MVGVRISLEKDYICLVLLVMSRLWCYPCVSRGGHEIHTSPSSSSYSRICFRRWPLGISSSTDLYIQPNKIPIPTHHSTHVITQLVNTHSIPTQTKSSHPIPNTNTNQYYPSPKRTYSIHSSQKVRRRRPPPPRKIIGAPSALA